MLKNTKISAYAWIRWKTSPYAYHILILEGALKHGTQRNLKMLEYIKNAFARFSFLTLFYMGGPQSAPLWFFSRGFLADAWNGLIFYDFVPFNIRQVLANPFFRIFFKMSGNFASKIFGPPKFWRENRKNWNWTIFSALNHNFSCWI